MSRTRRALTRALRAPGIWKARRVAELAVTPRTRIELVNLDLAKASLDQRLAEQAEQSQHLRTAVADIEGSLPAVLNAIASMSGANRMLKREFDSLRSQVHDLPAEVDRLRSESDTHRVESDRLRNELDALRVEVDTLRQQSDAAHHEHRAEFEAVRREMAARDLDVLGEVRPHAETLAWLVPRVETVRFEMLNELRYGRQPEGRSDFTSRIVNPDAVDRARLRLNIGAGHVPMEGYVNVDMRELPGIDVVATVDDLPFEPGTVDEIFSSHTLEHFPQEVLRRQLLPYWASLLKPGGILTTIAPDLESMSHDFAHGDTSFEDFRDVLYGGQEYEGDSHFTGFTPESFSKLLVEAGFVDPETVAADRRNGKCKEFEVTARKAE